MIQKIKANLSQITRDFGKDFQFFRKYYFPHYHKRSDSDFHKELSLLLSKITTQRGSKVAIAAPRESAKSTIISLEYVLYCICHKLESFIMIISSTTEQSSGFLLDIKNELTSNQKLIEDFPDVCEVGMKPGPPRWRNEEIITRNGVKITALGSEKQIRGRRNRQFRPSLIILDDLETDERLQSSEQYDKLHNWFTKSVLKSGSSQTNVLFIGTIHHYNSLLAQFTDPRVNHGWIKQIYRSIISWSDHPKLWEQWTRIFNHHENYEGEEGPKAAELFFKANETVMLEGAKVLWPENKSYYALMVMREEEGHMSFDSEMQNEPINPADCYFQKDDLHFWDDRFGSQEELISTLGENAIFYGACDPSLGKQNKKGDYSAIIGVVRDAEKGTIYVLVADIERRTPSKTIDDILAHHRRLNFVRFGFESNNFQVLMAEELQRQSSASGIYLPIEPLQQISDKLGRIQALQPLIKNGTICFSRKHHTLLEQMKHFPKGRHDDGLDALEMVVRLCKNAPDPNDDIRWFDSPDLKELGEALGCDNDDFQFSD